MPHCAWPRCQSLLAAATTMPAPRRTSRSEQVRRHWGKPRPTSQDLPRRHRSFHLRPSSTRQRRQRHQFQVVNARRSARSTGRIRCRSPPEPNSAEQSYSGGECSFYEQYRSFPSIGRYEFIWDAAKTPRSALGRPVIVEVSRDGIVWTSLATEWSPKKPHSAVAYLTMAGNLRIRVRTS